MHPTLDPVIEEYLSLSLTIERLFPGFVDGYLGSGAESAFCLISGGA